LRNWSEFELNVDVIGTQSDRREITIATASPHPSDGDGMRDEGTCRSLSLKASMKKLQIVNNGR
jgi:hypothetical protein